MKAGHVSTGPHVAQFATLAMGYVFLLHNPEITAAWSAR